MTPEKLLEAFDRFEIHNNSGSHETAIKWFVVDNKSAEPEVNWPGDLVSEHESQEEARLGWAAAIIKTAESES